MSEMRKFMKIVESVPPIISTKPRDDLLSPNLTVMLDPKVGGGTGRFVNYTDNDTALIDVKGAVKELPQTAITRPARSEYNGNEWFHSTSVENTIGTLNDRPEFRSGDMVKIEDVYGSVIGPGIGVFVGYGTTGQDCIVLFDGEQKIVPIENIAAILEQDAKDSFSETDNDGNLSPMSLASNNVKIENDNTEGYGMDNQDDFSKWIAIIDQSSNGEDIDVTQSGSQCGCENWNCPVCFPDDQGLEEPVVGINSGDEVEFSVDPHEADKQPVGVKLGDIVQKTEFRSVSEGNWYEPDMDDLDYEDDTDIDTDSADSSREKDRQSGNAEFTTQSSTDVNDLHSMMGTIKSIQDMGLSKADREFTEDDFARATPSMLKKMHDMVVNGLSEATRPTATKQNTSYLDDLDDILNPRPSYPLSPANEPEDDTDNNSSHSVASLPRAGANATRSATSAMNPSATMRDYMSRISPDAGGEEPELDNTNTELVVRTASDVPAVISNAMRATGVETPLWHGIRDLPGFRQQNIRGMGRQVFSMFTSTPLEDILTIANVDGQGPNTDAEVRAVAAWLRDNADDLGSVQLDHGMAIPGYRPDVKEFSTNGIRFHVVRDQMGQYIYAYPESDARIQHNSGHDEIAGEYNMPRLNENKTKKSIFLESMTLFERLSWDEKVRDAFSLVITESLEETYGKPTKKERDARKQTGYEKKATQAKLRGEPEPEPPKEKSQLSRRLGKAAGGKNLIKWLHARHRLDNEADLHPLKITNDNMHRPLWTEFKKNGDNFVIVSAARGVAGIKPYTSYIEKKRQEAEAKGKAYNPSNDNTIPYQIIAFTDDGTQIDPELLKPEVKDKDKGERFGDPTVTKARMGKIAAKDLQNSDNAFDLLTSQIGSIRTMWVTGVTTKTDNPDYQAQDAEDAEKQKDDTSINRQAWRTGAVPRDLMQRRADFKKPSQGGMPSPKFPDRTTPAPASRAYTGNPGQDVFMRVQPVLKKLANDAYSQLTRSAQRAMNGGNLEHAQDIMSRSIKIKQLLATIDTSGTVNVNQSRELSTLMRKSIQQAWTEEGSFTDQEEFVNAASNGETRALRPLLNALRDNLVSMV